MKIKLLIDLPISPEHGANAGREFKVTRQDDKRKFFTGDAGEECAAFHRECKIVEAN